MARTKSPGSRTRKDSSITNIPEMAVQQAASVQVAVSAESFNTGTVRTDTRVLIPVNLEDEIRRRAYELYERRGYSEGHETEDWLVAEQEVKLRYNHHSA